MLRHGEAFDVELEEGANEGDDRGPGKRAESTGEIIPLGINVGDTVLYSKYGGTEVSVGGDDLLVLNARDVLAIVG